jgi:hypothetical protein
MAKTVLIDELHITLRIPAGLPDLAAVRRTLQESKFLNRLRRAVRAAVRTWPQLASCRLKVSR